jgi:hypothetical protein
VNAIQTNTAANTLDNEAERMERLFFLSASTIDLSASLLKRLLEDARSGKLGDNARNTVASQTSSRSFSCAVKELSIAFAYLMIFDNGGAEMGEQKHKFVSSTFGVIDELVVGTSVKEIILLNSHALGYEICDTIAQSVTRLLGASACKELRLVIAELLRKTYTTRKNLLFDSLNLPREVICKAIGPAVMQTAATRMAA